MVEIGSYWYNTERDVVYRILQTVVHPTNKWGRSEITLKNILTGVEKNLYAQSLAQPFFVELSKNDLIKWKLNNG